MANAADQPGLSPLHAAVESQAEQAGAAPSAKGGLGRDALAGLTIAVSVVPDGMAEGVLIGVNPLYGLYANIVGPLAGALFLSTPRMVISSTNVAALIAAESLGDRIGVERSAALFLLVILAGAFQILFGLCGFDRATRFVSFSVMTGFLAGISVLLILSQLPTVSGIAPEGADQLGKAWSVIGRIGMSSPAALITAATSFVLAMALDRTRIGRFGALIAIAVPALLVSLFGWKDVALVRDIGRIPRGFPSPISPGWGGALALVPAALSLAAVTLIQGAGVSQSVPMPRGRRRSPARDFVAQGAANVASGFFQGIPVGGSLSATAIGVVAGGKSRWASVGMGLSMALVVVGIPGLVSRVAMPALGALLIVAGLKSIKPFEVAAAWRAGWPARVVVVVSFVATIALPIQAAVALSVLLSLLIHLARSSVDVRVVRLVELPDGRVAEKAAPRELPGGVPTVLDVYGTLYFAGARTLERKLPRPGRERHPVVILRLRGHLEIGATLAEVLADYEEELREAGGRLYVSGLSDEVRGHLQGTGKIRLIAATPILGESTRGAIAAARSWLIKKTA
jgi:SulP family sulfate permease